MERFYIITCYRTLVIKRQRQKYVCSGKRVKERRTYKKKCSKCRDIELQEKNTKTIKCIDCGKEFEVGIKVKGKKRCDKCQEKNRLETYRLSKKKSRKSKCPQS